MGANRNGRAVADAEKGVIASLAGKIRDHVALNRPRRRSHLDSVGEDEREHERSLSTSSAGSSTSTGRDEMFSSESGNDDDSDEKTTIQDNQCHAALEDARKRRTSNKQCNRLEHHQKHYQQQQNTRYVVSLRKVFLGYPRFMNTMQLFNTGHNWQVNLPNELANHTRKCR